VNDVTLSIKNRRNPLWTKLAAASLLSIAIAGCGGGSDGAPGATGATGAAGATGATGPAGANLVGTVNLGSNTATPTANATAAWAAVAPQVTVSSVSIASPPVVNFSVKDAAGNPVVGLGSYSQSSTATVKSLTNIAFTLAKLVPGANGAPSKWVSYLVTKPVTVAQKAGTLGANDVCDSTTAPTVCGTYPTTEKEGTLVDNGDGSYKYTFYRDVTKVDTIVASLIDKGAAAKADLGTAADLKYDANATTRLGIMISGSAPGTGTNTPTAVQTVAPVPMVNTVNVAYDFIPATGKAAVPGTDKTRTIVAKDSCGACHAGKGIGHVSTTSASNGIPAGSFVGRNDPNFCVTCHTDQTKFGFAPVATTATGYSGAYYRLPTGTVDSGQEAAFIYPRMIHQTHMGDALVKTGYNLNGHCTDSTATYNAQSSGLGQCFNKVGFPQEQRNCAVCHAGATTAAGGTAVQTTDGDNWKNMPSRLACGACHDGINFKDGTGTTLNGVYSGHVGGAKADDSQCTLCHGATDIVTYHAVPVATANNPTVIAGVSSISYAIKSVTLNASRQPVVTFTITKDGAAVTSLAVPALVTNASTGAQVVSPAYEPIPGFTSGPSIYVAYSVPQDGNAAPADFNVSHSASLTNLLIGAGSPKAGTLTYAAGVWTATLTGDTVGQPATVPCTAVTYGTVATCISTNPAPAVANATNVTPVLASPIVVPAAAKMLTGAIIGTFTQNSGFPTTLGTASVNANVSVNNVASAAGVTPVVAKGTVPASGGFVIPSMLQKMTATGFTGRRLITATAKCNACHDQLGTNPNFHGGARNDPTACAFCHTPNRNNGGWAVDFRTFIHGIHAGKQTNGAPSTIRTTPYTWNAGSAANPNGWEKTLYPGVIKNCSQCHLDNTVNFGATGGETLAPTLLGPTLATGATSTPLGATNAPYLTAGFNYGNGFSYAVAGATLGSVTPANATNSGNGTVLAAHVAVSNTVNTYNAATGLWTSTVGGAGSVAGFEIVMPQPTTLISSPIASACFACHDTTSAKAHMTTNGGAIYEARSTALTKSEGCLTCHGAGREFDAAVVHK